MRYPASEKLEIIRIVEQSHLPARRTLDQLGIARRTFYRWYDRYREGGPEALENRPSAPNRVWNRIGEDIQDQIVEMALEATDLSPRELAVRFTDEKHYFVSEATVYRLLKAYDLITSPAYAVIKAADQFHTKTTRPNEMWQTDFTYFKIIGWGWMYTLGGLCGEQPEHQICVRIWADRVRREQDVGVVIFIPSQLPHPVPVRDDNALPRDRLRYQLLPEPSPVDCRAGQQVGQPLVVWLVVQAGRPVCHRVHQSQAAACDVRPVAARIVIR